MNKGFIFFLLLSSSIVVNSCKTDFKTVAPYKEMLCVYGLIDHSQNPNNIRINRVFLTGGNAFETAQIDDSVNFKPGELSVTLQKFKDGVQLSNLSLSEFTSTLPTGDFNANQRLWQCNNQLASFGIGGTENGNSISYTLNIHNNFTGKTFLSSTKLIKEISSYPSGILYYAPSLLSLTNPTYPVKVVWTNPVYAKTNNLTLRFNYREYLTNDTITQSLYADKFVDWNLGNQIVNDITNTNLPIEYTFMGEAFYSHLKNNITNNTNVYARKCLNVQVLITAVGEEFQLYNDVSAPSNTIVQDKPIYSNISDGVGVFSSRKKKSFTKILSYQSVDKLADPSSPTCGLRFFNSNGVLSLGCQ